MRKILLLLALLMLAMINFMVMFGWLESLVDVTMGTFSYYCGVAGFCLGVVLSARLTREKPMELLNAFAPAGVLLAALARFGEVMLEGLLTLGVFALCITLFKKHRFLRSLFYLCLLQILCESLRSDSFTWLFVKVEQLICMLGVAGVLLAYCVNPPGVRRHWMPIIYCFPVAAVFVVLEFALNGKIPLFKPLCYAIMLAGLVLLSLDEIWAFRRMESKK